VGASPEVLVRRFGRSVTSVPMAGTVGRADEPHDDDAAVARLVASPKEAIEHRFVVDAVRETLAARCDAVRARGPVPVRLATVTHLATTVEATLRDADVTALDLALALHPTPAVGGTPRDAALALLAELEPEPRGCYGGPVGWVDAHGDGEFVVALRCAHLDGATARLYAGAGVVDGSDPGEEWDETEAKLAPMRRALDPSPAALVH
jgi:isochorismate synthase